MKPKQLLSKYLTEVLEESKLLKSVTTDELCQHKPEDLIGIISG